MKKLAAVLVVVALLVSGCAWICLHKIQITSGLNTVIATAEALKQMGFPAPVLDLLESATSIAKGALAAKCPDPAQLVLAEQQLQKAVTTAQSMGYTVTLTTKK